MFIKGYVNLLTILLNVLYRKEEFLSYSGKIA